MHIDDIEVGVDGLSVEQPIHTLINQMMHKLLCEDCRALGPCEFTVAVNVDGEHMQLVVSGQLRPLGIKDADACNTAVKNLN